MLFDQVINENGIGKFVGDLAAIRNRVILAQKFVLNPDFAQAADELSSREISEVRKIFPFARLPFAEAWFEVLHSDRLLFKGAQLDSGTCEPHRVGFLLKSATKQSSTWKCDLFWSSESTWVNSFMTCEFDGSFNLKPSEFFAPIAEPSLLQRAALKALEARAVYDWGGEGGYIAAVLALLNSRNVVATEFVDRSKMNRKRLGWKSPKNSFHIVRIDGRLKNKMEGDGFGAHLRAHFVRGHFKARATGVFWWAPFTRGNLGAGFVSKNYHVAGRR